MAGLLGTIGQDIGTGISTLGAALQIPNYGISQAFAASPTPVKPEFGLSSTPYGPATTPSASFNVTPSQVNSAISNPTGQPTSQNNSSSNTNTGSSNSNTSSSGPGYAPSFAGQTVQNGSGTYQSQLQNGVLQWIQQQNNAAAGDTQAQIQAAVNSYNAMQNQLEAQKPVLQNAYNTANSDLQNQINTGTIQAQQNQNLLTSSNNEALGQLGQNYQTSQGQNRELARAMGSFGTDYAQLQNKTNNNFQNNQTQMNNDYQTRTNAISQGLQQLKDWGVQQQNSLASQYQSGLQQIVMSETANDAQKAQAVTQLKAALGDKLASIQNTVFQLGSQIASQQLYNQNYMAMLGKSTANFDPFSAASNPLFAGLAGNAQGQQTFGAPTNQNQTAGGINNQTNMTTPQQVFSTAF